jgi:hypothetical protein
MHFFSSTRAASLVTAFVLLAFHAALASGAEAAPTVDTLKQVLERRLLSLTPTGTTERQVLFEEVRAGKPGTTYPFQVTASIRDYGPGYPANKFYGETCVGRMEKWPFELRRDAFGDWQVEGRMSITTSDGRQCKPNPSAGVSSIPLASLSGSAAPAAAVASRGQAAPNPQNVAAAGAANDGALKGMRVATATTTQPPAKQYHCVYFVGDHLADTAPLTITGNGTYTDSEGKRGTYSSSSPSSPLTFHGGNYDGQRAEYDTSGGLPQLHILGPSGRRVIDCD